MSVKLSWLVSRSHGDGQKYNYEESQKVEGKRGGNSLQNKGPLIAINFLEEQCYFLNLSFHQSGKIINIPSLTTTIYTSVGTKLIKDNSNLGVRPIHSIY